jgi:hypothetical protein
MRMFYALVAAAGFGVLITGLFVMDQREKNRIRARDARRDARQRIRIRDWTVMQWVFGSRAHLRITDRRGTAED